MDDPNLTPEQEAILRCIKNIDYILDGLESGIGSHDWYNLKQSWITASDKDVTAIFDKAKALEGTDK